jgi:hypothetical protein
VLWLLPCGDYVVAYMMHGFYWYIAHDGKLSIVPDGSERIRTIGTQCHSKGWL